MEILPRIFEPFFTTKEQGKGTGLGLAAVWGMLQDHKGAVTVYSEPNVGTVFHAYLPISDRTAAGLEEPSFEPVTGTGRILVVDDEEAVRITAERILTALEYEVITASDGLEAAEIFKKRHADIDLVLLDMIMPKMNGTETFEVMKRIDPAVRIVISSGFSKEEDLMELKNRGLIACIRKPYRKAELGRVVAEALAVFKEAPEGPLS